MHDSVLGLIRASAVMILMNGCNGKCSSGEECRHSKATESLREAIRGVRKSATVHWILYRRKTSSRVSGGEYVSNPSCGVRVELTKFNSTDESHKVSCMNCMKTREYVLGVLGASKIKGVLV